MTNASEDPFAPSLPPGYSAQPAAGFSFESGALCEFHRVYGPPIPGDPRGPVCNIDKDLSHWFVTSPGAHRPRWLTFVHARKLLSARLSYAQFSSVGYMQQRIVGLLETSALLGE